MMLDNNDNNDINNDSNPVQRENSKGNVELTTHKKTIKYDSEGARKIICRYGSGCTHSMDPTHKDKFWHPSLPKLNDEQIKSQFICNECGYGTSSLLDLQMHLKRKTAWSNASLVGCRISCLVDYKEWHEGVVTQFHKSGKHFVEFRVVNEKRWLLMKKIAFYIIERSPSSLAAGVGGSGEFKESGTDTIEDYLAEEDSWVYSEDLSVDYAFAQSVLFKIYGNAVQETGHLTRGHVCLTEADRMHAQFVKVSLLYGELLPRGTNKAFGPRRLDVGEADVLFDLGMGTGKIVVQAFLQFKNLKYVYGVELSVGRYKIAEESVFKMVALLGADNYQIECSPGKHIIVTEGVRGGDRGANSESGSVDGSSRGGSQRSEEECGERILHLECGNMFDVANIEMADVVMMETDVPPDLHADLYKLLYCMREGARLLSYLDLRRIWEGQLAFRQLESNRHLSDRYPTSWSVQRGHHFYFWVKMHVASDTISCYSATSHHGDFSATSGLHSGSVMSSSAHGTSLQQQQQRQILNYATLGTSESSNAPQSSSGANCRGVDCVEDDDSSHQPADSRCLPSFFSMFSWVGRSRKTDSSTGVVSSKPKDTIEPSNSVTAVKKPVVYKRSTPQISDRSVIPMQHRPPVPASGAVRGTKSSEMGSSRLRFDPSSEASLSDDEVEPSPNVSSKSSSNRNRSVPVGGQHSQGQVQQQKRSEKLSSSIHHPSADFHGDGAVLSFPSFGFGDQIPEQANDGSASNTLSVVTGRLNHHVNKGASSTTDNWGGRTDYTGLLDDTEISKGSGVLRFASDDATPLCVECSEGEDQELDPQPYALGQEYAPETFVAVRGAAGLRTPPRDPQEINSASPALALSFLTAPSPLGATPSDSSKKKGRSQKKKSDSLSPHLLLGSVAGDMSLIAEDAVQERCGESGFSLGTGPINA